MLMPLLARKDGTPARVAPYRQIMPFIMRTRNECAVYFSQQLDLTKTLPFIENWNARGGTRITLFHVFMFACLRALRERPRLNRFVAGGRLYDRKGIWLSYSAKKALNDNSPIVVLKRGFTGDEDFAAMLTALSGDLREGRGDRASHVDKELSLVLMLPAFLLRWLVRLQQWAYDVNLLPQALIRPDPMYASMFVANLGSLKLKAAYHHLYEYGNIPLFAVVGAMERVVALDEQGNVTARTVAEIKWSLDERTEDGLYCAQSLELVRQLVEDPELFIAMEPQPATPAQAATTT